MRDDCGLDQSGRHGSRKNWLHFESIFDVKPIRVLAGLGFKYGKDRGQEWLQDFRLEQYPSI